MNLMWWIPVSQESDEVLRLGRSAELLRYLEVFFSVLQSRACCWELTGCCVQVKTMIFDQATGALLYENPEAKKFYGRDEDESLRVTLDTVFETCHWAEDKQHDEVMKTVKDMTIESSHLTFEARKQAPGRKLTQQELDDHVGVWHRIRCARSLRLCSCS